MISVIVPVYKAEKVISRCIESVTAQEYQDWELILVDDGSPDKSGEICDEYSVKDKRIRVVHQENAGASAARNQGIEVARGEYICFIDADDYVSKKYLSDFFTFPDYTDFVMQGHTAIYTSRPDNLCVNKKTCSHDLKYLLENCDEQGLLQGPCCKLFKLDVIRDFNISYPSDISIGEDAIFVKQYLLHCGSRISTIARSNYFYIHNNTDSLTSRFHNCNELYFAIYKEYELYMELVKKVGNISFDAKSQFFDHVSSIFYQSIYSAFVDKKNSGKQIKNFIKSIDPLFQKCVNRAKGLPPTYDAIRFCMNYLPVGVYVPVLKMIFRF